ncbi:MAG: LysR family transcriptional regulator [Kiloniellales bacterium]|nr:LysR family transcriptional regulator [Kiloniellales bacterium]
MQISSSMDAPRTTPIGRLSRTDLHLLAVFMTVVETGGFAAAQVALNLGQSTVSRHMGDLEKRLGMRLCQRGRVGFRLTDKGRAVYESCQTLFNALEAFRTEVGALRGELVGELSVAVIDNWITDTGRPLADAMAAFKARGRQVHVNIHSLAPDEIEHAVLDGRVGLGIGVFHRHRPGLAYEHLYQDPVELYCGPGHPLFAAAAEGRVPGDLGAADLVRRGYLSEEQVAPLTAKLPSSATAHQIEGVAFMILSGRHVGYLPVSYAARWVAAGRMRSLLPERFRLITDIEIVTRKGAAPSLVSQAFLDLLKQSVDSQH